MELDIIRRVISEIQFKIERDHHISQIDKENYIAIIEALEKQIPKKQLLEICQACEGDLKIWDDSKKYNYCPACGQKIDWE